MNLEDHTVIVVGTSPNIGAGIALGLAAAGADVICVDRDENHAEHCAEDARSIGVEAAAMSLDATDEASVKRCIDETTDRFGRVDGLVNGAAYYDERGLLEMPVEAWRTQLDVILTSAFLFTKHVALAMIDAGVGGAVVNIASTAAHQGQPGNISYSTAKSGVLNFSRAAAMDLAPHRIRVNSITPTSTDVGEAASRAADWGQRTERWQPTLRSRFRQSLLPLGRMPSPTDYGAAVAFLLSPAANAITGTDLRVDSGALAKYWAVPSLVDMQPSESEGDLT